MSLLILTMRTFCLTIRNSPWAVDHAHILFDDQELALGGTIAVRTLVRKNGRLVSGFCEPRW